MSDINHEIPEFISITSGDQLIQIASEMKEYAHQNPIDMEEIAKKAKVLLSGGMKGRIEELWPFTRYIKLKGHDVQVTCTNDNNSTIQLSTSVYFDEMDMKLVQAIHEAFWGSEKIECKQFSPRLFVWMKRL